MNINAVPPTSPRRFTAAPIRLAVTFVYDLRANTNDVSLRASRPRFNERVTRLLIEMVDISSLSPLTGTRDDAITRMKTVEWSFQRTLVNGDSSPYGLRVEKRR